MLKGGQARATLMSDLRFFILYRFVLVIEGSSGDKSQEFLDSGLRGFFVLGFCKDFAMILQGFLEATGRCYRSRPSPKAQ